MKRFKLIAAIMIATLTSTVAFAAPSGSINNVLVHTIGMGKTLIRMGENNIFLQKSGLCFEGTISFTVKGCLGKRLICSVSPIEDESYLADNKGTLSALYGFTPRTASYNGKVDFQMPVSWLGIDIFSKNQEPRTMTIYIDIIDPATGNTIAADIVTLNNDNTKFDQNSSMASTISGMFGGVSGDLINSCAACDGTGICNSCYGDAFFDPKVCRKCANHPGICRRCNGEGEEGTDIRGYGSGGGILDLLF